MKDDRIYLTHMLEAARKVTQRVQSLTRNGFDADEDVQLALAHLLQTIGEAARLVSDATRQQTPLIPWHQITGMRHRIVHDYLNIDLNIVWDTSTHSIPPLIAQLEAALAAIGKPEQEDA